MPFATVNDIDINYRLAGGHACLWEHPASFNAAVLDFVRRHGKAD